MVLLIRKPPSYEIGTQKMLPRISMPSLVNITPSCFKVMKITPASLPSPVPPWVRLCFHDIGERGQALWFPPLVQECWTMHAAGISAACPPDTLKAKHKVCIAGWGLHGKLAQIIPSWASALAVFMHKNHMLVDTSVIKNTEMHNRGSKKSKLSTFRSVPASWNYTLGLEWLRSLFPFWQPLVLVAKMRTMLLAWRPLC